MSQYEKNKRAKNDVRKKAEMTKGASENRRKIDGRLIRKHIWEGERKFKSVGENFLMLYKQELSIKP